MKVVLFVTRCSSCLSSSSSPSPQSCALNNKVSFLLLFLSKKLKCGVFEIYYFFPQVFLDGICVSSASYEPSHLTVKFEVWIYMHVINFDFSANFSPLFHFLNCIIIIYITVLFMIFFLKIDYIFFPYLF